MFETSIDDEVLPATRPSTTPCVSDLLIFTGRPKATSVRTSVVKASIRSDVPSLVKLEPALVVALLKALLTLLTIAASATPPVATVTAAAT